MPSSIKINIKPSNFILQYSGLNDFKKILKQEFETLKNIRLENIKFFSDKDQTQTHFGVVLLADLVTTDSCLFIIRYPLSMSS
ncbi:7912_t:CDS:1, partial [Dentiscutata heterogama]